MEWWQLAGLLTLSHLTCLAIGLWVRGLFMTPDRDVPPIVPLDTDDRHECSAVRNDLGDRIAALDSRMLALENKNRWLCDSRAASPQVLESGNSLEMASKLAKNGTSVEELMEICDLGRGEAELIRVLNNGNRKQGNEIEESRQAS